jgi:rhombotail lipoprotein
MRALALAAVVVLAPTLTGCGVLFPDHCAWGCGTQNRRSSSLVEFLYPDGAAPPPQNSIPQLRVPLRVGLAFLPSRTPGDADGPSTAQREQVLERIRERFRSRKFIADIVVIPDYYLSARKGFDGLAGVQRLYSLDLMALVSYDQVTHEDDNHWSLGYLTIVGAYVFEGTRHEVATLVDLAVVDPATHSLVLRAGGTDNRHGSSTLIDARPDLRHAGAFSFESASDQMITHFDGALSDFESEVRAGRANVQVVDRSGAPVHGGGALGGLEGLTLAALLLARGYRSSRRLAPAQESECASRA